MAVALSAIPKLTETNNYSSNKYVFYQQMLLKLKNVVKCIIFKFCFGQKSFGTYTLDSAINRETWFRSQTKPQYIYQNSKTLATIQLQYVHSILSWLVQAEIKCKQRYALPKRFVKQFKPLHQSRDYMQRTYCLNIYTV